MTAYMAVEKLGFNDHGQMHAQVVAADALRLLGLLHAGDVIPDVLTSGAGSLEDAHVVVLAAAMLHDLGNQIAREGHEAYGVALSQPVLERMFLQLYEDPVQAQVLKGFVLSAIATHDCRPPPITLEGAIVSVADAADMTSGRGRVAFDQGKADIHAVSAMAIREVTIQAGEEKPAHIEVTMDNPAGLFQVEKLLGRKLTLSWLDRHISFRARVAPQNDAEQGFRSLVLRDGRFVQEFVPLQASHDWPVDPVCGMPIEPGQAAGSVAYRGQRYHLCSTACLSRFQDDPSSYLQDETP
jgi:metal-dependent HD superfamily phosphatase/phosphodiesterase/YHS domain-containing protein